MIVNKYFNGGGGSGSGATGPQGPQGYQGPIGPQGPQGADGLDGKDGADGKDGLDGAQGPQGVEGAQGPQGIEGQVGPQGPQGPAGPAGSGGTGSGIEFSEKFASVGQFIEGDGEGLPVGLVALTDPYMGSYTALELSTMGEPEAYIKNYVVDETDPNDPQITEDISVRVATENDLAGVPQYNQDLRDFEAGSFIVDNGPYYDPDATEVVLNQWNIGIARQTSEASWNVLGIDEDGEAYIQPLSIESDEGTPSLVEGERVYLAHSGDTGSGAQGPQGAQGAQGATGPQGATGAQGPQGPAGSGGGGSSYISDLQPLGINILEGNGVGYVSNDDGQGNPTQYATIELSNDGNAYVNTYTDDGQGNWSQNDSYALLRIDDVKNAQDDLYGSGIVDGSDNVLKVDPDSDGTTQVGTYEPGMGDEPTFTRQRYLVGSTNISKMVKITQTDYESLVLNDEVDENTFYIVVSDPEPEP